MKYNIFMINRTAIKSTMKLIIISISTIAHYIQQKSINVLKVEFIVNYL